MRYILTVAGDQPFEVVKQRILQVAPAAEGPMATAAEELIQQGIEKGIEKGIEQGEARGQANLLLRQLTLRFGPCPDEITARVHTASRTELDTWGERVLTAESLDAVFET